MDSAMLTTIMGGFMGGFTAKKYKFAGTIGGALIGAVVGSFLERYANRPTIQLSPPEPMGPPPMRQMPQQTMMRGQYR